MRRGKLAVASVFFLSATIVVACSSKSSDNGTTPTTMVRPDSGSCINACCELPQPNTSCTLDAGTMCTYAVTCAEGLVLSRSTTCTGGLWKIVNDCPSSGAVDERGCPSAQPTSGSPCFAVDGGRPPSCGYSKTCEQKVCDAGDCVNVHQSATANCINGMWSTTPIPPC